MSILQKLKNNRDAHILYCKARCLIIHTQYHTRIGMRSQEERSERSSRPSVARIDHERELGPSTVDVVCLSAINGSVCLTSIRLFIRLKEDPSQGQARKQNCPGLFDEAKSGATVQIIAW